MALLSCAALHESSSGANRLCRSQDALGPAVLTSGTTSSYTYSHTSASACRLQRTGSQWLPLSLRASKNTPRAFFSGAPRVSRENEKVMCFGRGRVGFVSSLPDIRERRQLDLSCLDLGKMAFSAGMVLPPPSLPSATDSIWFGGLWFGGPQLHLHDEDAQLVAREMAYEQKVRQPQTHVASPCDRPPPRTLVLAVAADAQPGFGSSNRRPGRTLPSSGAYRRCHCC